MYSTAGHDVQNAFSMYQSSGSHSLQDSILPGTHCGYHVAKLKLWELAVLSTQKVVPSNTHCMHTFLCWIASEAFGKREVHASQTGHQRTTCHVNRV